jgi:heavy metal translocating P-type ATPase
MSRRADALVSGAVDPTATAAAGTVASQPLAPLPGPEAGGEGAPMAAPPRRRGVLLQRAVLVLSVVGLATGGVAWFGGEPGVAHVVWGLTTALSLAPLLVAVARELLSGRLGVDLIALLSMGGALLVGEHLAGAVVALMLAGGNVLEGLAEGRARRELSALVSRSPRVVHRYEDGELTAPPLTAVRPGDRLLVRSGEVVPVDGVVGWPPGTVAGQDPSVAGVAVLDESALTGEATPVVRGVQERVRSGVVNAGPAFHLVATATSAESTYAAIVRLVESAQATKAPLVRLADRWALVFLVVTVVAAALAWWLSGDPVRAVAVLVVATPCPLILAAPVAVISGISRAAKRGVLVKGGGALEVLARGRFLALDKTGTVTGGAPVLADVVPLGELPADEVLRLAASLDIASAHVLAAAIVRAAQARELALELPHETGEALGEGIAGRVGARRVAVGQAAWVLGGQPVPDEARRLRRRAFLEGLSAVFVAVDGTLAGVLLLEDPIRPDAPRTIRALRRVGFERVVLLTGDHPEVADVVGAALGVDAVLAERSPEEKVAAVRALAAEGVTVMVGDGINDAPALAAAHVGIALGARGASASSEAADVVLVPDRLDRLVEAVRIARRSRRIALESIVAGMALSMLGMVAAGVGLLPPVAGALVQEGIDIAVIANALRALGAGRRRRPAASAAGVSAEVRQQHRQLEPHIRGLRGLADSLDRLEPTVALAALRDTSRFLVDELLPHERGEDTTLYTEVARVLGGEDPTGAMSRAHLEIAHLVGTFERLLDDLPADGPAPADLPELRRLLYGLYALLRLHVAQEEESYLPLLEEG